MKTGPQTLALPANDSLEPANVYCLYPNTEMTSLQPKSLQSPVFCVLVIGIGKIQGCMGFYRLLFKAIVNI